MAKEINRGSLRLVSAALLAAVLWHRGAEAAELRICVDRSSPAATMDERLAQAVGRAQSSRVDIDRFDGRGDTDDGLSARKLARLAAGCDLVMGFPVDVQAEYLPDGVSATRPYARTGFALVTRSRSTDSLDQLPEGTSVGVTYMTAPNLYFSDHPKLTPQVFETDVQALRALQRGEIGAAMLWRPFLARQLGRNAGATWHVSALNEPHAAWNLVALYSKPRQPAARQFEQAVEELRRSGELVRILSPYAEPPPAPPAAAAGVGLRGRPAPIATRWSAADLMLAVAKKSAGGGKAPPALYTDDQAAAGKQVFLDKCAMCHGPNLEGRAGPALKGNSFATPQAHFTVGDVFKIVSQNMPAPAPGTLAHDDYVKIMSFLLQQNGYPSGGTPLDFDTAAKSKVKLIYHEIKAN